MLQAIHLIFHQGDERRNHQGHAIEQERRQLVAQRFAAAGGHHHQGVFPLQNRLDDGLLAVAEFGEAKRLC